MEQRCRRFPDLMLSPPNRRKVHAWATVVVVLIAMYAEPALAQLTGVAAGAPCQTGYNTETNQLLPDGDQPTQNPPAGSINLLKNCSGLVIGTFTANVEIGNDVGFINLQMMATCIGKGGLANPCTVGEQVRAEPGYLRLQGARGSIEARGLVMVWPSLKRGRWKFEAQIGGPFPNSASKVLSRTFTVQAFQGG